MSDAPPKNTAIIKDFGHTDIFEPFLEPVQPDEDNTGIDENGSCNHGDYIDYDLLVQRQCVYVQTGKNQSVFKSAVRINTQDRNNNIRIQTRLRSTSTGK